MVQLLHEDFDALEGADRIGHQHRVGLFENENTAHLPIKQIGHFRGELSDLHKLKYEQFGCDSTAGGQTES